MQQPPGAGPLFGQGPKCGGSRGSSTIDMNTVIQFRMDKYQIKTKKGSPISNPSSMGQVMEEIKWT